MMAVTPGGIMSQAMAGGALVFLFIVSAVAVSAVPAPSPVLRKLDTERYQYVRGADGTPHLVDLWASADDLQEAARFDPDRQNVYHLFTRQNPTVSQPLLNGVEGLLGLTNYDPLRRTVILLHGWQGSATSDMNSVLVPAFLSAEDVNVIVVDWRAGADTINYVAAIANTVSSGQSIARFVNWLNSVTGATPAMYHIVGHSLGGHMAGIVGRNIDGDVSYITALDPAYTGWILNGEKFRPADGAYTEVIHTNAGLRGYIGTLGQADFYPNGGVSMPGCDSLACDHDRSFHYMAESLISGGFTGRRCVTYISAMAGNCILSGRLHMGGLVPKTGSSGIYHLETNATPTFSRVLLIKENAGETSDVATTNAVRTDHERPFAKGELARLIHRVITADDESGEHFDDDDEKKPKVLKAAARELYTEKNAYLNSSKRMMNSPKVRSILISPKNLDFNYFDALNTGALKSSHKDIVGLLKQNLVANKGQAHPSTDFGVRLHLIKNPEVLQKYQEDLRKKHLSTSSSSGYDDSLEYDRNIENFIRRNAVFRLDKLSEQLLLNHNSKLELRGGHDTGIENHRKNSREHERKDFKEKIIVSFKDSKHDDYNDKARHDKTNLNRNKNYGEEPRKKDVWDYITKNANKWDDKNDYSNYKGNEDRKKQKYDDYDTWNSKASKLKESKSKDQDQKVNREKQKKENSWDSWKSKSIEQGDSYNRGSNRREKPKIDDDWGKKGIDWDKPKKTNEWDQPKKSNDWDKPKKSNDWDKPRKNYDWDKPKRNNDWDKNNDDSWDQPKKGTKGIASFEDDKNDYINKKDFKIEEKKKATNEWDRAMAKSESGRGTANKKPFVPQISNYYNPRPRMKGVPDVHGFKSFGRTSIPFVGKKGIYDEN